MMANEEISIYRFNDEELDKDGFDYCLRAALIERRITKSDYLACEKFCRVVKDIRASVSSDAWKEVQEVINNF